MANGAYTSQTDSATGLPEGRRDGGKFYRASGDVPQADRNAALNVLSHSPAQLSVKWLALGERSRQPSTDKFYAQDCATF